MKIMYNFCSLALVLFITLYIIHYTLYIRPTAALEPAQPATFSSELKLKIKALQDEIASKAAQLKNEVSRRMQNRAYIGFIKAKSDTSLTVATTGKTRLVSLNEYTEYTSNVKSKTKFNAKTLAVEDYVAVLGDVDDNEVLTAKKVIKLAPPQKKEKQLILGQVISLSDQNLNLQTKDGQRLLITVDKKTNYQAGKLKGKLNDVQLNQQIIVVGEGSTNTLQARFIYILPGGPGEQNMATTSSKLKKVN